MVPEIGVWDRGRGCPVSYQPGVVSHQPEVVRPAGLEPATSRPRAFDHLLRDDASSCGVAAARRSVLNTSLVSVLTATMRGAGSSHVQLMYGLAVPVRDRRCRTAARPEDTRDFHPARVGHRPVTIDVEKMQDAAFGNLSGSKNLPHLSRGRASPFVKVNCAAISSGLLESELFGHEKGAFTGAHRRKLGQFEYANKGTIYLDEIGELPLALQAKLLHVLQDFRFTRVRGQGVIDVDARVIAATNRDLEHAIARGEFREDLYYRLNVVEMRIPPLRERKEESPLLASCFLSRHVNRCVRPEP